MNEDINIELGEPSNDDYDKLIEKWQYALAICNQPIEKYEDRKSIAIMLEDQSKYVPPQK